MDKRIFLRNKKIFYAVFIAAMTAIMLFLIRKNFSQIKDALKMRLDLLWMLIGLNIANKLIVGFKTKKILEIFNVRLSFLDWFGSAIVVNFYNYFAPKGGTAIAAVYFKKKYGLHYHKYISLLFAAAFITICTLGCIGVTASIYLMATQENVSLNPIFFIIFFAMIISPVFSFILPKVKFSSKRISDFLYGWHLLWKNGRVIFSLALCDTGILLSVALRYFVLFRLLSLATSLAQCILIAPFNIIMHFASLVPGGYGIKELTVGFMSKLISIGFTPGLIATLGDRFIFMMVSFILGPLFSILLFKRILNKKELEFNG